MDFVSKVEPLLKQAGFDHFGFTRLDKPLSMQIYREWLAKGYHGTMTYLAEHADQKEDSRKFAPRAQSAIVIAKPYFPHPYANSESKAFGLRTALYAQGSDYHLSFRAELEAIAVGLRGQFVNEEFLCFTDSAPILERDLAYRAGLGWVGKNTCLIDPQRGSLFFLGQILTSVSLDSTPATVKDFCGTCDRCIRACPTQAIEEPRKLNATKCISYWTIEARGDAPPELRSKMSNWFFGCDICQTVCPWNEKKHGRDLLSALNDESKSNADDLRWILTSSNKEIERTLHDSPILRARPRGLKRNALQIIGNLKIQDLRPEVARYLDDPHLADVARWAMTQLR